MIRSYREIKEEIKTNHEIDNILSKYTDEKSIAEISAYKAKREERFKADCKEFYKYVRRWHIDPLSVSIRNKKQWRTVSDDNGETCTDFIILPDAEGELSDEDIEQFVYDTVYCPSYYDFPTGKVITLGWHFTRTRCGVVIIHERGIDW